MTCGGNPQPSSFSFHAEQTQLQICSFCQHHKLKVKRNTKMSKNIKKNKQRRYCKKVNSEHFRVIRNLRRLASHFCHTLLYIQRSQQQNQRLSGVFSFAIVWDKSAEEEGVIYEVVECNNVGSTLPGTHKRDHPNAHWNTLFHLCYITQESVKIR